MEVALHTTAIYLLAFATAQFLSGLVQLAVDIIVVVVSEPDLRRPINTDQVCPLFLVAAKIHRLH